MSRQAKHIHTHTQKKKKALLASPRRSVMWETNTQRNHRWRKKNKKERKNYLVLLNLKNTNWPDTSTNDAQLTKEEEIGWTEKKRTHLAYKEEKKRENKNAIHVHRVFLCQHCKSCMYIDVYFFETSRSSLKKKGGKKKKTTRLCVSVWLDATTHKVAAKASCITNHGEGGNDR